MAKQTSSAVRQKLGFSNPRRPPRRCNVNQSGECVGGSGQALKFLPDQYLHCKPIMLSESAHALMLAVNVPEESKADQELMIVDAGAIKNATAKFATTMSRHRL